METKAVPEVANVVEKVVEVIETDNIRVTEVKPEFAEPVMVEAGAGEGGLENIPEEEQIAEDDLAAESVRAAEVSDTNNETVKECKTREAVKQTVSITASIIIFVPNKYFYSLHTTIISHVLLNTGAERGKRGNSDK